MNVSPFLSVDQSCDEVLHRAKGQLSQAGLRAMQTFDLHAARIGLQNCPCPNHGTDECDCQMVVVLVYQKYGDVSPPLDTSPVTLILHGNHGQTWLSLAEDPHQVSEPKLPAEIKQVLGEAFHRIP